MLPDRTWPVPVRPGSFETVDSYLRRLRSANFVTDITWSAWVKPTERATGAPHTTALPLIAEAVGGLDVGHFARDETALPRHADGEACVNCVTGLDDRFGCVRCTPGERVEQGAHDGPRVCRKHLMWVGPGTAPEDQYRVGVETLRADRVYRRLRRQGLVDAHRLAEVLACVDDWADAEGGPLDAARRFTLAVRLYQRALRPQALDAFAERGTAAPERYTALSRVVAALAGSEECVVLTDAIWLLIRSAGHQDQTNPHSFMCTAKEENVDERDELEQLRSSAYPRGRHRHLSQYVSSDLPGTRYARERQMSKHNNYACARGHRFVQRVLQLRAAKTGVGCGICSNKHLLRGFNSLADTAPHLVPLWHTSKNGTLRPEDIVAGSEAVVFWTCPEGGGHDYDMSVAKKKKGVGCPYCANKRVDPSINSLSFTHADIAAGWHPDRNGDLTPDDVVAGCTSAVWWRCAEAGHDFEMKVRHRTRGDKCFYCARKKVHPTTSLAATQPGAASRWHPSRNGSRTPADVLPGTSEKVWWLCEEKNHHYYASVLTQSRGAGCNICMGRVVDEQNCMRTTRPDLTRDFHPSANGSITPDNVMATTTKLITWLCENGHDWVTSGQNRANQGTGCPYCSNFSCWTGWNDIATVRPDLAADWDWENNPGVTPQDLVPGTSKRIAWKCVTCEHRWTTKGADRGNGSGCPNCWRTNRRRKRH